VYLTIFSSTTLIKIFNNFVKLNFYISSFFGSLIVVKTFVGLFSALFLGQIKNINKKEKTDKN